MASIIRRARHCVAFRSRAPAQALADTNRARPCPDGAPPERPGMNLSQSEHSVRYESHPPLPIQGCAA